MMVYMDNVKDAVRTQNACELKPKYKGRSFAGRRFIKTGVCLFMKYFTCLDLKYIKILTKKCRKCCLILTEMNDTWIFLRGTYFDGRSQFRHNTSRLSARCSTTEVRSLIGNEQLAFVK